MKIYDLPEVDELDPHGFIEITNGDSTTSGLTSISDYFYASISEGASEPGFARRNHFRGKNLGPKLDAFHYSGIQDGSFKDIWIGDYWEDSDGMRWRVVDIDYYMNAGDYNYNKRHHILVMPDFSIYKTAVNETESYYTLIDKHSWKDVQFVGDIPAKTKAIADKVFPNQGSLGPTYLDIEEIDAYIRDTNNMPYGSKWTSSSVKLPNQMMLAASLTNTPSITTSLIDNNCVNNRQLALFKITGAEYLKTDDRFWVRDMVGAYNLVYMENGWVRNSPINKIDDVETGIRPIIIIG